MCGSTKQAMDIEQDQNTRKAKKFKSREMVVVCLIYHLFDKCLNMALASDL